MFGIGSLSFYFSSTGDITPHPPPPPSLRKIFWGPPSPLQAPKGSSAHLWLRTTDLHNDDNVKVHDYIHSAAEVLK